MDSHATSILQAIVALALLSFAMFLWMYATRLPAFSRARIKPQDAMHPGTYHDRIPSEVRRVADNYNHLFEAPTLFYAIALVIVVGSFADVLYAWLAWAYVALRVAHSIVQATFNSVTVRFLLFAASWLVLAWMMLRLARSLF